MTQLFEVDVERDGPTAVVVVHGDLDLFTEPRLRSVIDALNLDGVSRIVLDLRGLDFMDSCGIAIVIHLAELANTTGTSVSLIPGKPSIQRVFDLAGLTGRLPFVSDIDAERRSAYVSEDAAA